MSNTAEFIIQDNGGSNYEPLAADNYAALCYQFIYLGHTPDNFNEGKKKDSFILGFEIPDERRSFKEGEPEEAYKVNQEFTNSLNSKSNLRKFLEAWRGIAFTPEELKGFNLLKLIGAPCMLNIIHKEGTGEKAGKKYLKIGSIAKLAKNMVKPQPFTPVQILTYQNWNEEIFASLPEYIQAKIKSSDEYQQMKGILPAPKPAAVPKPVAVGVGEDDLPF